jgi:alkane 1-monooxygenase
MVFFVFGFIPVLDIVLPTDDRNPTEEEHKKMVYDIRFKIPIYLAVILDWFIYAYCFYKIFCFDNGLYFNIGLTINLVVLEGVSINLSHELNHKTSFISKFFGVTALMKNLNTHFLIEHNYFHHVWVSTPKDTATSKLNQNILQFIYGSLIGGYKHGWALENERCKEKYGIALHPSNFMIYSTMMSLLFPLTGYYFFGVNGLLYQIIVGVVSSTFLEIINYIEHYGLRRRFISPTGKYENVTIRHSWNAPFRISNYLLIKLQRHSDHHENALKPYHVLASYPESPNLPQGYAVCLIVAVIPPVWFKIMNPLAEVINKGQKPTKEMLAEINQIIYKYVFLTCLITIGLSYLQCWL